MQIIPYKHLTGFCIAILFSKNKFLVLPDHQLAQVYAFQNKQNKAIQSINTIIKKGLNKSLFDRLQYYYQVWYIPYRLVM